MGGLVSELNPTTTDDETSEVKRTPTSTTPPLLLLLPQLTNEGNDNGITWDIGEHIDGANKLDDFTKTMILRRHWTPPAGYNFPFSIEKSQSGKKWHRHPTVEMFQKFPWLVYSKAHKGLYCRYCPVFLPMLNAGGVPLKKFVTKPVISFRKLLGKDGDLNQHDNHSYHKRAVEAGKEFLIRTEHPDLSVINQQDKSHLKNVQENRKMLGSLVKCIIFLGKQNIPLRGHKDDGNILQISKSNEGNFRELVRFRIETGDQNLEKHLRETACRNAVYTSKTIQNDLIQCCGEEIRNTIIKRIKEAKYFSMIFDETTDAAHESQLTFCVRYCHQGYIYEDFLDFIDPRQKEIVENDESYRDDVSNEDEEMFLKEPSLTGRVIAETVLSLVKKNQLELGNCVGIATDGCSTNVSELKGAVSIIKNEAVNATYCPCHNHSLNLSLTKASKVQNVRNAIDTMKTVISFFTTSSKRNSILKQKIGRQLIGLCNTRWVERHDSIHLFCSALPKISEALYDISQWKETEAASKALSLINNISNSSFLVAVSSLADILGLTLVLSRLFQKKELDMKEAKDAVDTVCTTLQKRRSDCEEYFHDVYEVALGLASDLGTEITLPRLVKCQKNRSNYEVNEVEKYYRVSIYNPLIDNILQDIIHRFPAETTELFDLLVLIPSFTVKLETTTTIKEKASFLASRFGFALTSTAGYSFKALHSELALWHTKWIELQKLKEKIPENALDALNYCDPEVFMCIRPLLQIFLALPVTTATAERSFSTLRRLKDWLRTTMKEDRLVSLALMNVHRELTDGLSAEKIVDNFAKKKNRKLDFVL